MPGKTVVATPLDDKTLQDFDAFCEKIHRNRAEVLRGLLYTLLREDKHHIINEWREEWRA
jgi:hypothetical protein